MSMYAPLLSLYIKYQPSLPCLPPHSLNASTFLNTVFLSVSGSGVAVASGVAVGSIVGVTVGSGLPDPDKPLSRRNNRKITFDAACRKMLFEIAKRHGLELEEEAEYGNRKYLEKQDFILAKQKEQLAAQQSKLDELTLKVSDMETLLEDVSAAAYDKAVEVVTDVVRTETRKEDMRMIEDTKKWVLSPERKAPKATREYAAHRLDTVLDKFLKTMQTTAARLQEKLLKPEVRQKGKEQVKEKARDSVLQLLNRLQAEQAQNKPAAQPRTQEGHSEI